MVTCVNCGTDLASATVECPACGAVPAPAPSARELRRQVTIVTSDLKGSTSLGEKLDAESLREVLTLYFDEMRAVFESHGGTIEKIIGDAIVAVFGLPTPRDDDALRAVQAAAETQRTLAALNDRLEFTWGVRLTNRTGVATGEAVAGDESAGEHILTGDVVQLANKLEQSAPASEVLIGESTYRQVASSVTVEAVEPVTPKGATEPVAAFRLVAVERDAPTSHDAASAAEARTCPDCGTQSPSQATVCGTCGAGLAARRPQESRKTVTIVFSDLRTSTRAGESLTPEALSSVMARSFEEARRVLEAHGGTVEKFIGDAVMAVFGLPVRHEDDALRAVRAADQMSRALANLAETLERDDDARLEVRIGVNTGEVVAGDARLGQRLVTGDAVNVAARLEQAAKPREVLIGEQTYGLARDAIDVEQVEPLTLKGKAQPVQAYRLVSIRSAEAFVRRQDAPMVGRERELNLLIDTYRESNATRECRLVTLVGDAGVGKTRLTNEFLESVAAAGATIVTGRCLSYGTGITFWPIVEVVQQVAGIREGDLPEVARHRLGELLGTGDDGVADRVASAVGLLEEQFPVSEIFWGIRKLFENLAADRPLVVLFDDIHWAETTFLELVAYLADATQGAAVTLLCTARHELLERDPNWAERDGQATIVLRPLSDEDAARIVENLLGQAGLADSVRARIVQAAEGNPLFVEQLLSMLIDSGMLRLEGDRWAATADLSDISIPPSIHALLAARLDQLPDSERAVIEPASVVGVVFPEGAVRELVADEVRDDLDIYLSGLTRKQFVRPNEAEADAGASYRFQHQLIRDAAYQGLLKRARVLLHERFVVWADSVNRDRGTEFEEILGYHLEQAHRYRAALGPLEERGIAVGVEGARRLASAGRRAMGRGDMPAAANLLRRAAALLQDSDPARPRLLRDAGEALMELGEFAAADDLLATSAGLAGALGDTGLETSARLMRLQLRYQTTAGETEAVVLNEVEKAIPILEGLHDYEGLARAWRLRIVVGFGTAQYVAAERAAEQAIHYAGLAGDNLIETRSRSQLATCALYGQTPVPDAIHRCEQLLIEAAGDRKSEAIILAYLAHLEAMRGEFARARQLYRRSRATLDELGVKLLSALTSLDSGWVELLADDPIAAEGELRGDYETLDRMGERNYISTTAAVLSEALYRQGRYTEADDFTRLSEQIGAPDDITTQFLWRSVRARLLARRGEDGEAESLARESVRLIRRSDDLESLGHALLGLSEVLALAGRIQEAAATAEDAVRAFEGKGNTVSATRAQAFRKRLLADGAIARVPALTTEA